MDRQTHHIIVRPGVQILEVIVIDLGYHSLALTLTLLPEVLSCGPNHFSTMLMFWYECPLRLQVVAAGSPLNPNWHELKWLSQLYVYTSI
jgi:hypothetical protein